MNDHSPIVSEFDTPEQAAAYEQWLREKVAASLANPLPPIPHDEVMAEIRAIIEDRQVEHHLVEVSRAEFPRDW